MPPVANILASPGLGTPPLAVTLSGAASTADVDIVEYSWDFGDGTQTYASPEPVVEHTFAAYGEFTVTLTITDDLAATSSASTTVSVSTVSAPRIATIPARIDDEVWYDYALFAIEHSLTLSDAANILREATWVLSQLTNGRIHGERCWQDTYKAPIGRYLDLHHGPIAAVSRARRGHTCSLEYTDLDVCIVSDRTVDVGCLTYVPSTWFTFGEWMPVLAFYGCNCRLETIVVDYTEQSTLVPGADRAVKALADEYVAARTGGRCRLPERVTTVTRQGMSWTILDPQDFLQDGLTGIGTIDHWLSVAKRATVDTLRIVDPLHGALLTSVAMSCDPDAPTGTAEERLWTRKRGDDWRWSFTTADDVSGWDEASVVVQVRTGTTETDELIFTSIAAEGLQPNITVTADFNTKQLAWHIDDLASLIPPGVYWLEVQCEIDGDLRTILTHWLRVTSQIALDGGS